MTLGEANLEVEKKCEAHKRGRIIKGIMSLSVLCISVPFTPIPANVVGIEESATFEGVMGRVERCAVHVAIARPCRTSGCGKAVTRSAEEWADELDKRIRQSVLNPLKGFTEAEKSGERLLMIGGVWFPKRWLADALRGYAHEVGEAVREEAAKVVEHHKRYYPHPRIEGSLVAKTPRVWQAEVAAAIREIEVKTP